MLGSTRISWKRLAGLCHRVGTSLSAGLDLRGTWQRESVKGPSRYQVRMNQVREELDRGENLADAMATVHPFFPEMVTELVAVGERTGKLDEVFLRLGQYYDHLAQLRRRLLVGMIWPAIQLAVAIIVVGLLILVAGWVSRLAGETIDFLGFGLIGIRGLIAYVAVLALLGGAAWLVLRGLLRGWFATRWIMRSMLQIPAIGSCVQSMAMTRMAWALALTSRTGLDARQSVRFAIGCTRNAAFTEHTELVDRQIAKGNELHEALEAAGVFPAELIDAVEVGERSGNLDQVMERLSRQYEERAQAASSGLAIVAAFATWGIVAIILISLIFRLAIFYRDMILSI